MQLSGRAAAGSPTCCHAMSKRLCLQLFAARDYVRLHGACTVAAGVRGPVATSAVADGSRAQSTSAGRSSSSRFTPSSTEPRAPSRQPSRDSSEQRAPPRQQPRYADDTRGLASSRTVPREQRGWDDDRPSTSAPSGPPSASPSSGTRYGNSNGSRNNGMRSPSPADSQYDNGRSGGEYRSSRPSSSNGSGRGSSGSSSSKGRDVPSRDFTRTASKTPAVAAAAAAAPSRTALLERFGSGEASPTSAPQSDAAQPYPTFVPRNPGITDGAWGKQDEDIVFLARKEGRVPSTSKSPDDAGLILLGKSLAELEELALSHGQPRFRGKQLLDGVNNGAKSIAEIPVIPEEWRKRLSAENVRTGRSILQQTVSAPDGTKKMLLQLSDGRVVETVGIPVDEEDQQRLTVCVSSQVGCPMRCTFCATGKGGFARNLHAHEIVDQVLTVQEQFGKRVSNVVFMGMGEPLLNLPSVTRAYELLNKQVGIGGRFMTISTVGIPNAINRLAEKDDVKATLAVSLHAPNQELRESIVPSAKAYPLKALMRDCDMYGRKTGRRVTFEYTLLAEVNDKPEHAEELAKLLRHHDVMSHINLIAWNPVDDSIFQRPSNNRVHAFRRVLEDAGLVVNIRRSRGLEAAAACGQLRNMHQKVPLPEFALPG